MNSFQHRRPRLLLVFTLGLLLTLPAVSGCSSAPIAAQQAEAPAAKTAVRTDRPAYLGILYSSPSRRASYDSGYDFLYENPYDRAQARKAQRGARIVEVIAASPAERAGLRTGDTIVSANGEPIVTGTTLNTQIRTMQPGDTLHLVVIRRNGSREVVPAELEALPERLRRR